MVGRKHPYFRVDIKRSPLFVSTFDTKLQSCHCEERSDVAIYPIEIASHSFAMTSINSSSLNATWYETQQTHQILECEKPLSIRYQEL